MYVCSLGVRENHIKCFSDLQHSSAKVSGRRARAPVQPRPWSTATAHKRASVEDLGIRWNPGISWTNGGSLSEEMMKNPRFAARKRSKVALTHWLTSFLQSLYQSSPKKKHPKVVITPHKTDFWTSTFACPLDHQSQIFGSLGSSQGPDRTTTFSLANSPWPCPTGCIDVTWV